MPRGLKIANSFADPLLMNAFNNVNQAAACLLADTETAAKLGIPQDHWIYPTGGAGYHDSKDCETYTDVSLPCN